MANRSESGGDAAFGVGAVVLMGLCCGAPLLIASGALGVLGRSLRSPVVIAVAAAVGVWGAMRALRRSRAGTDRCCGADPSPRASEDVERDASR